jgi:hypothetical protein
VDECDGLGVVSKPGRGEGATRLLQCCAVQYYIKGISDDDCGTKRP